MSDVDIADLQDQIIAIQAHNERLENENRTLRIWVGLETKEAKAVLEDGKPKMQGTIGDMCG